VHEAPVVGLEQAARVGQRHVGDAPVDRHAGVVHPRVDRAERLDRALGRVRHLVEHRHVGHHVGRAAALGGDGVGGRAQVGLVARHQHHARAAPRGGPDRGEPDAARRARDDDHLVVQLLEGHAHA
jgi:hypothetical protein